MLSWRELTEESKWLSSRALNKSVGVFCTMAKRLYQVTDFKEYLEVIWLNSLDIHHTNQGALQNIPLKDTIIHQLKTKTKQLVS